MSWFAKVKNWWSSLFKKEVDEKSVAVHEPVVEARPIEETAFAEKVKASRALSPDDLLEEIKRPIARKECDHVRTFLKQAWVRVSDKKFELQNEMICTKCKDVKILPIG